MAMTSPEDPGPPPPPPDDPTKDANPQGFRLNGLGLDAFRLSAAAFETIRTAGLSTDGLRASAAFGAWFEGADGGAVALHADILEYLVACALGPGERVSYTDAKGVTHRFAGDLGLARGWAQGGAATEAERQFVTACLMAHANTALPEPRHIQVALRGAAPLVAPPYAVSAVLGTFDGAFFGDLFTAPQRLYVCSPTQAPPTNYLATLLRDWGRECYFSPDGCGGVFRQVDCTEACEKGSADAGYVWGPTCTVEGRRYPVISAYVPSYRGASGFATLGATLVACESCFDRRALSNMSSPSASASITWTTVVGGAFVLDVHYAHAGPEPASLRVEVDGALVKDGGADRWDFPATGGRDVWRPRSIPVVLKRTSRITFRGAGTLAPLVDAVWLRMP